MGPSGTNKLVFALISQDLKRDPAVVIVFAIVVVVVVCLVVVVCH